MSRGHVRQLRLADVPGGVEGLDQDPGSQRRAGPGEQVRALEQQPVRAPERTLAEVGEGPHVQQPGPEHGVARVGFGPGGERAGPGEVARLGGCLGRDRQPACPRRRVGAQLGGTRAGGGGSRVPAALRCLLGGPVETGGDLLVRLGGTSGAMPGAAPGVVAALAPLHRVGERPVHCQPLAERRLLVDRRPDQRVPERERLPSLPDQPGPLGRREVGGVRAERLSGAQHQARLAHIVGRGDQQQQPGSVGQPGRLAAERREQPAGQRELTGISGGGGRSGGELDQRQRIALRLGQDPVAQRRCQVGGLGVEERRRRFRRQPGEPQLGQALRGEPALAVPGRHDQRDAVLAEPARGERQRRR